MQFSVTWPPCRYKRLVNVYKFRVDVDEIKRWLHLYQVGWSVSGAASRRIIY